MWRQGQHPPSNSANTMKSENNEDVSDTVLTYGSHLPGDDTYSENITRPDALDHPGSQVGLHNASQDAEHVGELVSTDGTRPSVNAQRGHNVLYETAKKKLIE